MPIRIYPTCKHCGLPIEPTEPMGAWTHTGLSTRCTETWFGFSQYATPVIRVTPVRKRDS